MESGVGAGDWFSETVEVKWQRGIYINEADRVGDHHQDKNKASPPTLQGSRKVGTTTTKEEKADLEGETQNKTPQYIPHNNGYIYYNKTRLPAS